MDQEFASVPLADLIEMRKQLSQEVEEKWREYQTLSEKQKRLHTEIMKQCEHDWKREFSCAPYGETTYVCSVCNATRY